MYRIGLPFWKTAAKMGILLKLRVDVMRDHEANMFVATSDDLRGLVAEAATMDELVIEVKSVIEDLLIEHLRDNPKTQAVTDLRLCCA